MGATLRDFLDKPRAHGGLEFSRFTASAVLLAFVVLCLLVIPQRPGHASPAEAPRAESRHLCAGSGRGYHTRMIDESLWGPLAQLIGEWEGSEGRDVSYHNAHGQVRTTPYRERVTMDPFGPVANGPQLLYGLDYRMAAWRPNEDSAFHTEIGYWLWDAADGHIIRCFMVPRGTTVLAGGDAKAHDTSFTLDAALGSESCGILSSRYLLAKAKTTRYTCKVSCEGGVFRYDSTTTYVHGVGGEIAHTDSNVLHRVRKT